MWIDTFRSFEFPAGAVGCCHDRGNVVRRVDDWDVREARRRAHRVLLERQADVLALADRLQRDRVVKLAK
jgi:hypothetical protein